MNPDLSLSDEVKARLRDVPDFPRPGIVFKDITPLLADGPLFRAAIEGMLQPWGSERVQKVVGIESRGFVFAAPMALALGAGLIIVRKPGKLPWKTVREEYALEYGSNTVEMQKGAVEAGQRVLLVDDLLATGGTAAAAGRITERLGAEVVGCVFLIELK